MCNPGNLDPQQGIQQILCKLEDEQLFSLAATVTQGFLRNKVENRPGAIEAILKYSSDIQSILRRKVVTRDILFSYAHESNIPVTLPATKHDLISAISKCWHLKESVSSTPVFEMTQIENDDTSSYPPQSERTTEINTLAVKFSEWFYSMMNSDQPVGAEHFWKDAHLKLHLLSASQAVHDEVSNNPEEIARALYCLKCEHNLHFNPNFLSNGIQGRIDPHGLVVVLACGTLHCNNVCVGVFEQVFMLARDPFADNNWKIKNTEFNLINRSDVKAPPKLSDGGLTSNLLALPYS